MSQTSLDRIVLVTKRTSVELADFGNRICVVAQKTVGDLGPGWRASDYFKRVSEAKEIQR